MPADQFRRHTRFHGRVERDEPCAEPGCKEPGEFRAPLEPGNFDGPGAYRWLCLEHVREFNARYNYFSGMSAEEIVDAQTPYAGWANTGWATETRAFAVNADRPPRWADFHDPLDAISGRFRTKPRDEERKDGKLLSGEDRRAMKELDLDINADRKALRTRYAERLRRFHPDRNGGDRSHEAALGRTIKAYNQLKGSAAFG